MGIIEELVQSAIRIETLTFDGEVCTGTGFIMHFLTEKNGNSFPVIITNKHVIENSKLGKFRFTLSDKNNLPDLGEYIQYEVENFEEKWILHPNPNVDLAAFSIGSILNQAILDGKEIFYRGVGTELIPSVEVRRDLSTMEEVIMIGYPNGIWDEKHNLPVIRRGITATHSNIFWNGSPEFLTDIASFPGSSGSPVYLANMNGYTNKQGGTVIGSYRIWLLGVHYAGAMHTARGDIQIVTAPTSNKPVPITQIPNNIGVAINSNELLVLEQAVKLALEK